MHVDQLTPPLFQFGLMRMDSPAINIPMGYARDIAFFKAHLKRRVYIREACIGEFDLEITQPGDWLQVPRLHLLITQLSNGLHIVMPIYRGKAFFNTDVETDGEVGTIAFEMSRRGGYDMGELLDFAAAHATEDKIITVLPNGNGLVH